MLSFMPDAPQRIATDTSQKLSIRFGETIKKYIDRGLDKSNLVFIPLVLAGYARYLKALDDNVKPEPMLNMKFWVIDSVNAARGSCSTRIRTSNISWEAELTC